MSEIEALKSIDEALSSLEDGDARQRVLEWANAKFGIALPFRRKTSETASAQAHAFDANVQLMAAGEDREMPGIALITDDDQFKLTVRDPKARSTNDAAIRLALVTIYAYCELTGESSVSSRKIVKPILEDWRAYTGNTRVTIANHQGVIRNGDTLSLDRHAKREAEEYVREILDDSIEGQWQPTEGKNRRKGTKSRSGTAKN